MTLFLPTPGMLLAVLCMVEAVLMRKRLSRDRARTADRGSLPVLILVIGGSITAAWLVAQRVPGARLATLFGLDPAADTALRVAGLAIFAAGVGLRWYAMAHLGRFFTFDVAVADDHRIVDTGPYRRVRHPAYTGSLLSFVGLGLCGGGNAIALPVLLLPIAWAFMHRIRIEEEALLAGLGDAYADYARRTWRLVPFVY